MNTTLTPEQLEQLRTDAYDEERPWVAQPTEAERPRTGEERAIEEDNFYRQFGFTASQIEWGDSKFDEER